MLSIGENLLLPLIFASIIAILISPAVNFMVQKRVNRTLSIAIVLFIAFLVIAGIVFLMLSQASLLRDAMPQLIDKFQELLQQTVAWASMYFNISVREINTWVADTKDEILNNSTATIGKTISTVSGVLATVFLTPVYVFMILFYQPHLIAFVHKLFGSQNESNVAEVLTQTKSIIQLYLVGLFAEFAIIAFLNAIGLFILGIQYAILIGILGAVLNIIPYIGGLIGVGLFMAIALVTKPSIYVLYVFLLYVVIQFIDNNYIVPKIVGSKVKLNALVSIIVVLAGAALWGVPGMFLSIPLTAIIKLILDRFDALKAWGFLLGDSMPPLLEIKPLLKIKLKSK
jgi:predicted PurR-regulated permease PerM